MMTRPLDHRKEMIKQASILIDFLHQELLKARAEKESAEKRGALANLKLERQKEMLREAQQTLNAKAKERDNLNTFDMQSAKKHIDTLLRALSMHMTPIERTRNRKARPNQTGLTRSRPKDSRVDNRAAHAARDWSQRGGSKNKEATDSGEIYRVTCARRREKTLPILKSFALLPAR